MSPALPDLIDPWRAAENGAIFAGRLPLGGFPRLKGLLLETAGEVVFRLAFGRGDGGVATVTCEAEASLVLRCQRCLDAMERRVGTRVEMILVDGLEEAGRLEDRYEPLLVTGGLIRPRDLIEDELLLGLPQIPKHEGGACLVKTDRVSVAPGGQGDDAGRRPFAVLAAMKRVHKNRA
jgi:uncharacterized protein